MDNYVMDSNFSFKVPSKRDIFYLSGLNEQILDFVYEDSKLGNNNNIMPGSPRAAYLTLNAKF